jgi:hypothetical protein
VSTEQWLTAILLGGVLGVVGQLIRALVGLKKESQIASAQNQTLRDRFDTRQFLLSLGLGFVAGALAMVGLAVGGKIPNPLDGHSVLALIASGYAGADFIEGILVRAKP